MIRSIAVVMLLAVPVVAQESIPAVEEPPTEIEIRIEQIAAEMRILNDRLNVLTKEVKLVDGKVEFLDEKMGSGFARMDEKVEFLDEKMDSGFARMDERVDLLDEKMDSGFARMQENFDLVRKDLKLTRSQARTSAMNWAFIAFIPATVCGGFIGAFVAWRSEKRR